MSLPRGSRVAPGTWCYSRVLMSLLNNPHGPSRTWRPLPSGSHVPSGTWCPAPGGPRVPSRVPMSLLSNPHVPSRTWCPSLVPPRIPSRTWCPSLVSPVSLPGPGVPSRVPPVSLPGPGVPCRVPPVSLPGPVVPSRGSPQCPLGSGLSRAPLGARSLFVPGCPHPLWGPAGPARVPLGGSAASFRADPTPQTIPKMPPMSPSPSRCHRRRALPPGTIGAVQGSLPDNSPTERRQGCDKGWQSAPELWDGAVLGWEIPLICPGHPRPDPTNPGVVLPGVFGMRGVPCGELGSGSLGMWAGSTSLSPAPLEKGFGSRPPGGKGVWVPSPLVEKGFGSRPLGGKLFVQFYFLLLCSARFLLCSQYSGRLCPGGVWDLAFKPQI